jgi:dihydrodipicolinate synthase/N-acetylneuraminate lyase
MVASSVSRSYWIAVPRYQCQYGDTKLRQILLARVERAAQLYSLPEVADLEYVLVTVRRIFCQEQVAGVKVPEGNIVLVDETRSNRSRRS